MEALGFLVVALAIVGFGLVSKRLERTVLTPPIVFVALGFAAQATGALEVDLDHGIAHLLAEVTLLLILFVDATRIDLARLRRDHDIPLRLLTISLPLTVVAGTLAARWVLPGVGIWEAALLAAMLAPTDAALGQAVVADERVPVRVRQSLSVESGLNDGLALPLVLLLLSVACTVEQPGGAGYWARFAALQLTVGPAAGVAVAWVGGHALAAARRRGWMTDDYRKLALVGIALLAFAAAEVAHGNGFLAAFCCGLVLGNRFPATCEDEVFAEAEGDLLTLLVFLVVGAVLVPRALPHLGWREALFALLALTVVRMLPTALALLGKGLEPVTVVFLGWFGPRGVASVLFALLVMGETPPNEHEALLHLVVLTVLFSVVAHGATAAPGARWYHRIMKDRGELREHRPMGPAEDDGKGG